MNMGFHQTYGHQGSDKRKKRTNNTRNQNTMTEVGIYNGTKDFNAECVPKRNDQIL